MSNAHPLIGKTVTNINIATDKMAMQFVIKDGEPIVCRTDGDCCSNSWIEHVELPVNGFPFLVKGVEDLGLPKIKKNNGDDEDIETKIYGVNIATDKGDMVIDFRNESNGFYGGDLIWPGQYFYGGVYNQNVSKEKWKPLTKDI
jgi:hypothetical protein